MVERIVRITRKLGREIATVNDVKEYFWVEEWSMDFWGKESEKIMGEEELKKLTEQAYKLGFEYEKIYGGCAQSTIAAIQDSLGLRDGGVFKTGTGLAGGGGLTGIGDCGAYVAGIMVLSQLCGRERSNFEDPGRVMRVKSYNLVKKLIDEVLREFGTISCRDIQMKKFGRSYYIRNPEDRIKFQEAGAHNDKCTDVVGKAAQMATKIIVDEGLAPLT